MEECINKNICINQVGMATREKLRSIDSNGLPKGKRKEYEIRIEDESVNSIDSSRKSSCRLYEQVIEEAADEEDQNEEE